MEEQRSDPEGSAGDRSRREDPYALPDIEFDDSTDAPLMDSISPELPIEPAPIIQQRRFCGKCGSVWQVEWVECAVCSVSVAAPAATPKEIVAEHPLGSALALYFVLLGSFVFLFFADPFNIAKAQLFVATLDAVIVVVWLLVSGVKRTAGPNLIGPPIWYPLMIVAGVCTFLLAMVALSMFVQAFGMEEIRASDTFRDEKLSWTVIFFAVCIQPAVIEEIAFRGIILGGLRRVMSDTEAIVTSALMFAILHVSVLSIPHLFAIGAVAAYVRIRSGSLLPCMLLHFVHNGLVLLNEAGWFGK